MMVGEADKTKNYKSASIPLQVGLSTPNSLCLTNPQEAHTDCLRHPHNRDSHSIHHSRHDHNPVTMSRAFITAFVIKPDKCFCQ